jgi:hypothetical protein
MGDFMDEWASTIFWVIVIAAGIFLFGALVSLDDSETWSELPDGCLLRTEVTRTWLFDERTDVSIWCRKVP